MNHFTLLDLYVTFLDRLGGRYQVDPNHYNSNDYIFWLSFLQIQSYDLVLTEDTKE